MIRVYSVEKTISKNGTLQLEALPFSPGEMVDVLVLARKTTADAPPVYALKNSVLRYDQPFEPVAEGEWDALK